ncbi:MAG: ABC transporter permease [Myxococcales bacterium]|nr:ABC transporter permease [Myxococcales bacterium]MCB9702615.1 ABC transporter permease [Myxococcales bacterium]
MSDEPSKTFKEAFAAVFASVGRVLTTGLEWIGGLVRLLWDATVRGLRRPYGIYDIFYHMVALGVRSLPLATVMSIFCGMVLTWQFGEALIGFGAKNAIGYASSLALVRELVPIILALTVGAKMATGMAAELGSMKVSEQIDAIASLGADPVKKLIWPRLVAATWSLPLLAVWGNVLALGGGAIIADTIFDVPADYFYETYIDELWPSDYLSGLAKTLVFGLLVGAIGCYQGITTKYGTEAVGISTTNTVVATSVSILAMDFVLTTIFLPVS